jgi:D-proline reductase (dithiol) PrdB
VTRLTDLPPDQAKRLAELECPDFKMRPWVTGPALSQRRVAIVSSAGLVVCGDNPFRGRDPDYRAIPSTVAAGDLLCSHISINFDRTGFQEDWNVVFPLDRLNELAAKERSARWPRRTIRKWAPPIPCKWNPMRVSWPAR